MTTLEAFTVEPAEKELVYAWFREQRWTEEAYLSLSSASNHFIELSDGRLVIHPMPTLSHQRAARRLFQRLTSFLEATKLGEALFAPHPIRLWPGKFREPDVMVWLNKHSDRMGEQESGPPDLVLEIHSPSTSRLDLGDKFQEYELAEIPEYWMADLQARRLSVFALEGRRYKLLAHFGPGQSARSTILPGFEVAVDDVLPPE